MWQEVLPKWITGRYQLSKIICTNRQQKIFCCRSASVLWIFNGIVWRDFFNVWDLQRGLEREGCFYIRQFNSNTVHLKIKSIQICRWHADVTSSEVPGFIFSIFPQYNKFWVVSSCGSKAAFNKETELLTFWASRFWLLRLTDFHLDFVSLK